MNVDRKRFGDAVRWVCNACEKGLNPLFEKVMVWPGASTGAAKTPGGMFLAGANDVFWVEAWVPTDGEWSLPPKGVLIGGHFLHALVERLDNPCLEVRQADDNGHKVRFYGPAFNYTVFATELVELRRGVAGEGSLAGGGARSVSIRLGAERLADGLTRTLPAASREKERGILQSVLLEFCSGRLNMVATNGRWLSHHELVYSGEEPLQTMYAPLPLKSAQVLKSLLTAVEDGLVELELGEKWLTVTSEVGWKFCTRYEEGNYPRWRTVVPNLDEKFFGEVAVNLFETGLRRAATMTTDKFIAVRMDVGRSSLKLCGGTESEGLGRDEFPWQGRQGPATEVGVNPEFLGLALQCFRDCNTVKLGVVDGLSPLVLRATDGQSQAVVMPMRLA